MRCMKCGTVIKSGTVCPHCGTDAAVADSNGFDESVEVTETEAPATEPVPVRVPPKASTADPNLLQKADALINCVKWLLVLNILLFLSNAFAFFSGSMYGGSAEAEEIYAYYGNALRYTDIFMVVLSIAFAVLCLVTALSVHQRKSYSATLLITLYVAATVVDFIYGGLAWKITGVNVMFNTRFFVSLALRAVFAYIYVGAFRKRQAEFVN